MLISTVQVLKKITLCPVGSSNLPVFLVAPDAIEKIHTSCNEQKGKTARVYHQSWICTTNSLATERESPRDKGGDVSRDAAPHVRVGPARAPRRGGHLAPSWARAGVATSDASKTSAWPVATTTTGGPRRRRRRRLPPPSPTINTSLLLFPPPHKQTNHHLFFLGCS